MADLRPLLGDDRTEPVLARMRRSGKPTGPAPMIAISASASMISSQHSGTIGILTAKRTYAVSLVAVAGRAPAAAQPSSLQHSAARNSTRPFIIG